MKTVKSTVIIYSPMTYEEAIKRTILAARNCYQSFDNSTPESDIKLIEHLAMSGHTSITEQTFLQFKVNIPNGIHLEWVRHRTGQSHAAESSRWNRYSNDKFGHQLTVVEPLFCNNKPEVAKVWQEACEYMENAYMKMLYLGATPQEAASVLNKSLKTSDVISANFTGMKTFFNQRCTKHAHPGIRSVALSMLKWCYETYPAFFRGVYNKFQIEYDRMQSENYSLAEINVVSL